MDCPVCQNPMITAELEEVEVDLCDQCGGIWLDSGELEILMGSQQRCEELLRSLGQKQKIQEKPRKCPICLKKMQKIIVGQARKPLIIDKCRRGDGLWFDKGELREILNHADLDAEHKIQKTLAELFGQ